MSSAVLVAERICENCGARPGSVAQQCPDCGAPTPTRSPALDGTDPAPVRRRSTALLIDAVPVVVLLAAAVFALATSADAWWWPALLGLALAWLLLLLGWGAANGQGPGAALTGVRVVDGRTGRTIGVGRTIVRQLARIGLVVGTLGVSCLSYRWDPAGRERTWWDRVAGSRVIASGEGDDPGARFVDPAVENRWTPQPPIARVPGVPGREGRPPTPAPTVDRRPVPPLPPARSTPWSAPEPGPLSWPPAVRPSMVHRPPTAADPDPTRVVRRTEIPGSAAGPDTTDVVRRTDVAGAAAGPDATGIVLRADINGATAASDATHVVPRTEIAVGRPATATLAWDSGSRVIAGGVVIIGRDPVPGDGERVDRRLAVGAESVGVSKTHLTLTITAGGITVTDRFSTNGVRIERADEETVTCVPGEPTPARQGDRIRFGGRSIVIAPPS